MRIILKIAKNELRHLFYSPIGWLLALIMLVMSAVFYNNMIFSWSREFVMYEKINPFYYLWLNESYTAYLYSKTPGSYFISMMPHLYLFVPLLTMGILNKEFTSGTIRLMYSSPVKLRQILAGKYLAMMLYNLALIGIISIPVFLGFFNFVALDFTLLLSGLLGIYLYLCALTAIGFFMSSLTNYQIVAAIASFTLLFILSRIGTLWQEHDFIRDITWFLSLPGRTEKFLIGLVRSKDVLYFLVMIFIFLGFTYCKLQDGLESRRWYLKILRYLSVVAIGLIAGYLGSRPVSSFYLDTSAQQYNTLGPKTQQLLGELHEAPLEVTLYVNLLSSTGYKGYPGKRNEYLSDLWEQYQRFKTDIIFKYEYFYAATQETITDFKKFPGKSLQQIAGIKARSYQMDSALFKPLEAMSDQEQAMLRSEDYRMIIQLKYKDRSTVLRTYSGAGGPWPDQENMNAGFSRLLNKPIPKVFFVTGQAERSIYKKGEREYFIYTLNKFARGSLINTGFDADSLNLTTQDIPATTTLLVLPDPKMELPSAVFTKLQQYIRNGGNMMFLGEPGKQAILNPLLAETGVQLMNGQLVQMQKNETPEKIICFQEQALFSMADEKGFRLQRHLWSNGYKKDTQVTGIASATSLSVNPVNGFKATPLIRTNPNFFTWLKAGNLVIDSVAPVFSPQEGDSGAFTAPVVLQLTRKLGQKEQRIIVCGDADMLGMERGGTEVPRAFYSWGSNNMYPVYVYTPYAEDIKMKTSPQAAYLQRIIFIWIVPALTLITACIILIRRKRK